MTPRSIAAAFRGIAEVVRLEGQNVQAVRGPGPTLLLPQHGFAVCTACEATEAIPDPPASMGAGEARTALLAPGTKPHGLFIASWLHVFARQHFHESAND